MPSARCAPQKINAHVGTRPLQWHGVALYECALVPCDSLGLWILDFGWCHTLYALGGRRVLTTTRAVVWQMCFAYVCHHSSFIVRNSMAVRLACFCWAGRGGCRDGRREEFLVPKVKPHARKT